MSQHIPPPDQTQPVTPVPPSGPPPPPSQPTATQTAAPTGPPTGRPSAPDAGASPAPHGDPGPTATLPPAAPGSAPARATDRGLLVRAVLGVLVLGLTVLALVIEENASRGYEAWTTWAVFATVVAAVHLLPLVWRTDARRVWDVVAIATGGLVFYWLALVLPMIGNATSFVQTLAVACAIAHLWVLPGRR